MLIGISNFIRKGKIKDYRTKKMKIINKNLLDLYKLKNINLSIKRGFIEIMN